MKLWLIERNDEVDYDETGAILVRAADETAARDEALRQVPDDRGVQRSAYYGLRSDNITITEVTPEGESGFIIGSFLHG